MDCECKGTFMQPIKDPATTPEEPRPSFMQKMLSYLGYDQKIYLIFILVLIAVLVIGYYLAEAYISDLNFLKKELVGLELEQKAENVLENVIRHKILAVRYHLGDEGLKKDLVELQGTISKDLNTLIEYTKSNEKFADFSQEDFKARQQLDIYPIELQKQWEEYANTFFETQGDMSDAFHGGFVANLQELFNFIGESSNLHYDYQPETHHLIQINLLFIPRIQDLTSQLMTLTSSLNTKEVISAVDYNKIVTLVSLLKDDLDSLKLQYQKAVIAEGSQLKTNEIRVNINTTFTSFQETAKFFLNQLESLIRSEKSKEKEISPQIFSDINLAGLKFLSKNYQLWEVSLKQIERLVSSRYEDLYDKALFILILILTLIGLAALFSIFAIKDFNRYYSKIYQSICLFRDGDLRARAPVAYDTEFQKISDVLNQLAYTYENLINQLQISGIQLTSSVTELAAASKNQQNTVFRQEATVKEILVTAGEISSTSKQFAKTMNEISDTAEGTSSLAALGKEGLGKMEGSMRQMVHSSESIASKLGVLNEKAKSITSVITTITKVADQTNLLSLNAAIEAEKAGDQGKSFFVIAREIRRLADQTAQAALDIEKMITEMNSAVSAGVMGVDKFSNEITTGVEQVSTVSGQLSRIIEQVQQETASFESANKRMQSISLGAEQINQSILQLNESAKMTADSIREYDSAILLIKDATSQMQAYVAMIKC